MTGIRCDYSNARDCCECEELVCRRYARRANDWDEDEEGKDWPDR